ncbi:glutamate-cysteine ligase modifier subunit [Haematobia irritans]|uniref:glutamate-cysteine ligase modifier subunit n=1 Tax=Haematobia irritans TaxID=7368 RepID=UPI003F507FB4
MLNEIAKNPKWKKVLISTGNILNVDATPLRTTTEELLDSLKLCNDCQAEGKTDTNALSGRGDNEVQVLRAQKELQEKLLENQRNEISIGVKLFINKSNGLISIEEAVKSLMAILKVDYVDNLVVAYHPQDSVAMDMNDLKGIWNVLQECAEKKQICQLGIADLDSNTLRELCAEARIQPTIAQINLANCCVVPPELKEFCTEHDIQLLTHGDPEVLIADDDFIIPQYTVDWSMRYQVHLRCRGVLTARGYVLQATKK